MDVMKETPRHSVGCRCHNFHLTGRVHLYLSNSVRWQIWNFSCAGCKFLSLYLLLLLVLLMTLWILATDLNTWSDAWPVDLPDIRYSSVEAVTVTFWQIGFVEAHPVCSLHSKITQLLWECWHEENTEDEVLIKCASGHFSCMLTISSH
jgi:hypothetical protein